ncbi:MAG TPA: phosphate ABC transporter permease PstA [Nitrospirales bacterium]|nr:phosphate ABC transporter permease PstA [Nitrospirales bacterium]HIC05279.1 phosphate ABC transporter permease PstA [Nitrospirales bacterium]HIO69958.1 phosphate ABC transporter permease PstA [Nitrospirales bacterium]
MKAWFRKVVASGDLFIWGSGAGLAIALLMIIGLVALIGINGLGFFWTPDVLELTLDDGTHVIGELTGSEQIPNSVSAEHPHGQMRIRIKVGNRDLYGQDFRWIDNARIVTRTTPSDVVLLERREWGNMYARIQAIYKRDSPIVTGGDESWKTLLPLVDNANLLHARIHHIERDEIGHLSAASERARLKIRKLELALPRGQTLQKVNPERYARLQAHIDDAEAQYGQHIDSLEKLYVDLDIYTAILIDSSGLETSLPIGKIIRALRPNSMSFSEKTWLYIVKVWEVLADEPREANTEGGLFPAIIGTVMMVLLTSIIVVPFGVITALYLGEYARQGVIVKIVRIAINNLAGVPSIVIGIFGLGFFIYAVGGTIDTFFFAETLPNPTFGTGGLLWAALTLALLTVPVAIVATEEGLAAVPRDYREASVGLGATKFETIWRVVLPVAMPGILTGFILAIARATGEVAPLMLTGVVKLAPDLPLDTTFPFVHLDRKFMHLGFHIYDVGFQSPNVEAAMPMIYVTTLVLLIIVVALNLLAITLRQRLRKKYAGATV